MAFKEVATKEDVHLLREDLLRVQAEMEGNIREVREELLGKIQEVREELHGMQAGLEAKIQGIREEVWKLRLLVVVVLVVVIVLNPKVLELIGRILGVAK